MTPACSLPLIHQLRRKRRHDADEALGTLLDEVQADLPDEPSDLLAVRQPMASLDLHTPLGAARFANSQSRKSRPRRSPADLGARLSGAVGLGDLVLAHGDLVDAATRVRVGP